jgi:hypothetical protein
MNQDSAGRCTLPDPNGEHWDDGAQGQSVTSSGFFQDSRGFLKPVCLGVHIYHHRPQALPTTLRATAEML